MAVSVSQAIFESVIRVKDAGSATIKSFADNVESDMTRASQSFTKEAEKASGAADKFDKTAAGSAGTVARLAGGVGTVAAAMALFGTASAIAGLRTADSFQKAAARLGTTTEALSKLAFHAKLSDLPFEQLTQSMGTLAKNLTAVAATGRGQAASALEKLGLDAKALIQLKPEEQIETLAGAFEKIESQTEKLGLLQQLFGRGGAKMADFFEGGPAALAESARYLAGTGGVIDSLTGERAEAFFNNLTKLSQAFEGIKNSLAKGLAKDLVGLTGALVDLVQDSGGLKAAAVALELTAKSLLFVLKVVATGGALIATSFGAVARAVAALVASAAALGRGDFASAAEPLKAFVDDLKKSGNDLSQTLDKLWGKLDEAERKQRELEEKAARRAPRGVGGAAPAGMLFPIDIEAFKRLVDAENTSSGVGGDAFEQQAEATAEFQSRTEQREREHQERLLAQWQTYHAARARFQVRYDQLSLESTAFLLNQVAQLMQSKSRTMFEIGKAAAIAETIVQTYKAAQGAYAALASIPYVGPALGIAAAAAAIASGMARVAAIKSTQFGAQAAAPVFAANPSTGLPAVAASTTAAAAAPPSAQGVPAAPRREVNIYLTGEGSPTQAYIRDVLIPGLQEALEDGVRLNVRTV